jgi:hypothetical protein
MKEETTSKAAKPKKVRRLPLSPGRTAEEDIAQALRDGGFTVEREFKFHPYVDARADFYAHKPGGPAVVIDVKLWDASFLVSIDDVQQVQHMARLLSLESGTRAVGLLVTTGKVTSLAKGYAALCRPPVYVADVRTVKAVLAKIAKDWSDGGDLD